MTSESGPNAVTSGGSVSVAFVPPASPVRPASGVAVLAAATTAGDVCSTAAAGVAPVSTAACCFCSPHPKARNATIADAVIIKFLPLPAVTAFIALLPPGFGFSISGPFAGIAAPSPGHGHAPRARIASGAHLAAALLMGLDQAACPHAML